MISLYIVPVHQRGMLPSESHKRTSGKNKTTEVPAYQMGISVLSEPFHESKFPFIQTDGSQNLERLCADLVNKHYGYENYSLEFNSIIQPNDDSDDLKIVYRVIHHQIEPNKGVTKIPVLVDRVDDESKISIDSLDTNSLDYEIAISVVEEMHHKIVQATEAKSNTDGYKVLLSLLPEYFDAKEIQLAFDALSGKSALSGHLLSNSLLKNYRLGYKEKDPKRPPVTGRNLIQKVAVEVPDGDDQDNYYIVDQQTLDDRLFKKRNEYKENYPDFFKKGGNRVTTLFRKKEES